MRDFAIEKESPLHFVIEELEASVPHAKLLAGRELLLEYGNFLVSQGEIAGFCYGALEREAADLPQSYLSQGGGVLLAGKPDPQSDEIRWVGSIAWRALSGVEPADSWEIKRLWTRAEVRGKGVGRALVEAVMERARVAGKCNLLLDTVPTLMTSAVRLYEAMGFLPTTCYSDDARDGIVYMRKTI
jgi:GNAT superfamily N-acetyltransferase